jgi:hypothetical protein
MQIPANPTGINKKLLSDTDSNGNSRYRCVEILPGSLDCCMAARGILGQRFLNNQIPSLPLDACDAPDCQCSYEHLPDRRTHSRRVSDAVGQSTSAFFESQERPRISTGRRQGD